MDIAEPRSAVVALKLDTTKQDALGSHTCLVQAHEWPDGEASSYKIADPWREALRRSGRNQESGSKEATGTSSIIQMETLFEVTFKILN